SKATLMVTKGILGGGKDSLVLGEISGGGRRGECLISAVFAPHDGWLIRWWPSSRPRRYQSASAASRFIQTLFHFNLHHDIIRPTMPDISALIPIRISKSRVTGQSGARHCNTDVAATSHILTPSPQKSHPSMLPRALCATTLLPFPPTPQK